MPFGISLFSAIYSLYQPVLLATILNTDTFTEKIKMKIIYPFFISSMLALAGCNPKNNTSETHKQEIKAIQKKITFDDFKRIKGVDDVQDVPFHLFTRLDSVRFFVSPDKDANYLKVAYNKLDNYYGFEEFDDFYSIHYSINNRFSNSIEAFVLKSEFTPASELTFQGVNLYEIRSSMLKGAQDLKNKSFSKYGIITEVSKQEFETASKNRIDEALIKNPHIRLKGDQWMYTDSTTETIITRRENASEDGMLSYDYVGLSPFLHLEVFKETVEETADVYYTFYNVKSKSDFELFTGGYPQVLPDKNWITSVASNNDTGSNFEINKYRENGDHRESLLYVNFTNFKIADETKAFWKDHEIFYAEVYPTNATLSKGKKPKVSYIKIQLKADLF